MKEIRTKSSLWTINEEDQTFHRAPYNEGGAIHPNGVGYDLMWHPYSSYEIKPFLGVIRLVFSDPKGLPIFPASHGYAGVSGEVWSEYDPETKGLTPEA